MNRNSNKIRFFKRWKTALPRVGPTMNAMKTGISNRKQKKGEHGK